MYRVFEALDELVQTLEQAYGVPMTSNCMVPRNEMLGLLDDLRNALPVDLDDAQDVLDKQDEILRGAQDRADMLVGDAEEDARRIVSDAHSESESMLSDAQARATIGGDLPVQREKAMHLRLTAGMGGDERQPRRLVVQVPVGVDGQGSGKQQGEKRTAHENSKNGMTRRQR